MENSTKSTTGQDKAQDSTSASTKVKRSKQFKKEYPSLQKAFLDPKNTDKIPNNKKKKRRRKKKQNKGVSDEARIKRIDLKLINISKEIKEHFGGRFEYSNQQVQYNDGNQKGKFVDNEGNQYKMMVSLSLACSLAEFNL